MPASLYNTTTKISLMRPGHDNGSDSSNNAGKIVFISLLQDVR